MKGFSNACAMEHYIQVSFFTKSPRYSVASTPISIPASSSRKELNDVIRNLLEEGAQAIVKSEFDFLVGNEFLTGTLSEFITEKQLSLELIEIEYCERQRAPCYYSELPQDDLISAVKRKHNYVLTGSYDHTVQVWDLSNSSCVFRMELNDKVKSVEWLDFDPNEGHRATFVTGGFDQSAYLWTWDMKANEVKCMANCRGHSETVMTIASVHRSSDVNTQLFATGSWDGTIKLWSADPEETDLSEETGGIGHTRKSSSKIPTRIPRMTLAGHRETVTRVCCLGADSRKPTNSATALQLISVSWDHTLRLWDCQVVSGSQKGDETRSIVSGHAFHDADAASQGILTASSDNRVRIYDLRASEALAMIGFQGHAAWLTSVAWAPHRDNQFVTGSIDRSIRLWDTRNPRNSLYDLMGHSEMVTDVDWAPATQLDGRPASGDNLSLRHFILSASADGSVKVYEYPDCE